MINASPPREHRDLDRICPIFTRPHGNNRDGEHRAAPPQRKIQQTADYVDEADFQESTEGNQDNKSARINFVLFVTSCSKVFVFSVMIDDGIA